MSSFRSDYLDYDALTAQLEAWAQQHPDLCRLESLGTTEEGRSIHLLTVGRDPDRIRPAAWIDGNMHACELAGSSVCLAVAEDLIALHQGQSALPAPIVETLRESLVYIVPRISPDGAECVLKTGRYVRSVPRDQRPEREHPRWVGADVDGDGLAFVMRQQDPTGEFVESKDVPGLLLRRTLEDTGPFYKVYPEGHIEHWDGHTIPTPSFVGDNDPDLNRNFPYHWAPANEQIGAGRYPMSETESRVIVEFAEKHPNIFAWLNLHTFGGVHIRPLGNAPDSKMNPGDLALWRQVEAWTDAFTGYPMVSGYEEFTYEPDKPLHGDLSDFAYHQRGALSWVCEIWDVFERAGLPKKKRFVDRYLELYRDEVIKIAQWDQANNETPVILPWRAFDHPQLGPVEVGGIDPRFGLWNPPRKELAAVCEGLANVFLRVAAMSPRVELKTEVQPLGDDHTRVVVEVTNAGYLATFGIPSSQTLPFNEALHIDATPDGCELVDASHRELGHLEGWGRGRGSMGELFHQRSSGSVSRAQTAFTVRGKGVLKLRVGSCRVGYVTHAVEL